MGKNNKRKKTAAPERLELNRLKMSKKKENPFEKRFEMREKHQILNRKSSSKNQKNGIVGNPGESRAKAIEKRKKTLLQEYKLKDKKNVFLDKRIGENDPQMNYEEKMAARFAKEMTSKKVKKNVFNLNDDDDETLTHFGKNLADIENMTVDPRDEQEGDEDGDELLQTDHHFGGFMTRSDLEFAEGKSNTRKDWIDNMIAESKKKKAEKQKNQEDNEEMTRELDEKWKGFVKGLKTGGFIVGRADKEENRDNNGSDNYDSLLKELNFDAGKKSVAKDRLKSEEEIVKEEKEKLVALEAQRLKRMRNDDDDDAVDIDEGEGESDTDGGEEESDDEEESVDEEEESDENEDLNESEDDEVSEPVEKKAKKAFKRQQEEQHSETEIPFTFEAPENYEDLVEVFEKWPQNKVLIAERIIKCNHPKLANENKSKLESFFAFLIQFINDEEYDDISALNSAFGLIPLLYDLAQFSPQNSARNAQSVLKEKYEEFARNPKNGIPLPVEVLIFLKMSFDLFPGTDYRHPVTTPAFLFISHFLNAVKVDSRVKIAQGLFLTSLALNDVKISKRFSPEITEFVKKLFTLKVNSAPKVKKAEKISLRELIEANDDEIDDQFKVNTLSKAADLMTNLLQIWKDLPSIKEIFAPAIKFLNEEEFPPILRPKIEKLVTEIKAISSKKKPLTGEKKKPKVLKLYEPEIEDHFDPDVKKRPKNEKAKLEHKMKREFKAAKKDIRADNAFLAAQRAKEIRFKDMERVRKTKEIMSGLGVQEGEFRLMQKKGQKRKR